MAIAIANSTSAVSGENSGSPFSLPVSAPTGGAVGDLLIAIARSTSAETPAAIATPTGWTLLTSLVGGISTYAYYKIMTSADLTATYTFTATGGTSGNKVIRVDMTRMTGVSTSSPIDGTPTGIDSGYQGSSTQSVIVPSITTSSASSWQFVALSADDIATSSPLATGFTAITNGTDYPTRRLAYRVQATAGATPTSTWTWPGTYAYSLQAVTFALRAAAATDSTAPTAPTNLAATAASSTQVNLTWTASTDNVGVTGYDVIRGNTTIATGVSGTSYSDTAATAAATFNYTVKARDAAGNLSAASNTATITTPSAGSSGTVAFSPTFAGTNGAAWPSVWTGSGGGSATIQSNLGRVTTDPAAFSNSRIEVLTGASSQQDSELTGSVTLATVIQQYLIIGICGSTDGASSGYCINMQPGDSVWQIGQLAGVGTAPSTRASVPFTFVAGQKLRYRIKRVGGLVTARVWVDGTTEPSTWGASWTDSSPIAAGYPFISYVVGTPATAVSADFGDPTYSYTAASGGGSNVPAMPNQVSGTLIYTTAAGTPVYKYEVVTDATATGLTTGQKQAFLYVPGTKTTGGATKLCLAAHGLGDDPSGFMEQASITDPILRLLADNGYVVIVPQYDGTLGNSDGQARLLRAYNYLLTKWTTTGTVLFGFSMGGATSGVAMFKGTIPNVKAVQLVSPVINFGSEYPANPSPFNAAYNATDANSFATATAAWDPARQPASAYSGQRWRINSATNDGYTNLRPDSVAFLNYISGYAAQAIDVQVTGAHGSAGQFVNPDQMIAFYEAAMTAVAGRVADRWNGTSLVRQRFDRWNGTALTQQTIVP